LNRKKIIVTGSSGFIGTNFINMSQEFEICEIDLINTQVTEIDFRGVHAVLHLAALVHQMKGAPESKYFEINRDMAFEVAKKAKADGVKQFVLLSTVKVYGESNSFCHIINEKSSCNPTDAYGKSKYEAEVLIRSLDNKIFKVAVIRSPLVYGAGVKGNMFYLVKLIDKYPILPLGGINNFRSLVYVGNLIAYIKRIIEKNESGIFIALDQTSMSTSQLVSLVAKYLNKKLILLKIPEIFVKILRSIKPSIYYRLYGSFEFDNILTNNNLNFSPPYSCEEGIKEMADWYKTKK
jgi:nucleoside-diphosphate-sugar epimerase